MEDKGSKIHDLVRERYGTIANKGTGCCSGEPCGESPESFSLSMGYTRQEIEAVPEGADLGLGCGAPLVRAGLESGMSVLDLGSGSGFDVFLAAREVGMTGRVMGVDMTPEMISKARNNALKGDFRNVEFRLGEIEHLPVADGSVDVVISNCVLNLSPDKRQVLSEVYRVLKPGGRIVLSDVVRRVELTEEVRENPELLAGCVAGAETIEYLEGTLGGEGFVEVRITPNEGSRSLISSWAPGSKVEEWVVSAIIEGKKPKKD